MLRYIISLRLIMLVAAAGTATGAAIMFWQGSAMIFRAALDLYAGEEPKLVTATVMGATDVFLFGVVLVIFAYAITFGFVFELAPKERRALPNWMRPTGMHELKMTLVSVILVYLVVDFATDWAESGQGVSWEMLVKPISVLLLAATLRLFTFEADYRKKKDEAAGALDTEKV
ncbi:MAG TPA: YqhA family protein [Hyphomicrobium sp.]|nr:YqhA family protein [Hyphomicrobium sp.]